MSVCACTALPIHCVTVFCPSTQSIDSSDGRETLSSGESMPSTVSGIEQNLAGDVQNWQSKFAHELQFDELSSRRASDGDLDTSYPDAPSSAPLRPFPSMKPRSLLSEAEAEVSAVVVVDIACLL